MLEKLDVAPERPRWSATTPTDDVDGARAVGMDAWLVDRDGRFPEHPHRLTDLRALPAALGLVSRIRVAKCRVG